MFNLLLGTCTHTRWNNCCRKFGNGHFNQVSILKNWRKKVMAILLFSSLSLWRPCWFTICRGRWEYFTILFEISYLRFVEDVVIDTKMKSMYSLIRNIFVIEWFHLISRLLRKMLWINSLASGSFLVLSAHILHFHKKPCSTVEPLTNDHPHQRPPLSYDHISCDGQWFLFVYESLTSDHPSYTTTPMWFWGWSYKGVLLYSTFLGSPFAK